ncbi:hypothetical protein K8I61_07455 [bacterium]|nr:hypothetical protein [bacterium]
MPLMIDIKSLAASIRELSDNGLSELRHELLTNPRVAQTLGGAVNRVATAKRHWDRNVSLAMSAAGIPSKNDYDHLATSALSLARSIERIEERLDEMLVRVERLAHAIDAKDARR